MAQLICRNLSLGYDGKEILSGLDFSVNSGDYLCIIGENGSGKSTLMKTLLGLRKPMKGSIETGDGLLQSEIGYLPQQTPVQKDFPASVFEIVISGCQGGMRFRPFNGKKEKELAEKAMQKMNIIPLKSRCYRELSGGQQQRVLLARALCAAKKLLLLDEPVSGLDPKVTSDMYRLIGKLNREDGMTVIMISHDLSAAVTWASHILYIGKKIFFGTKDEYLSSDIAKGLLTSGGEQ